MRYTNPRLLTYLLETSVRVASNVGNLPVLPPNFGTLGLWILELFATYATDGQTDRNSPLPLAEFYVFRGNVSPCRAKNSFLDQ